MKRAFLLLACMAIGSIGFSQTLSPVVLANAGGYAGNEAHLSWTIGEVATATLPDASQTYFLTQGFQQPENVGLVPVIEVRFDEDRLTLHVYPNPAQDVLFLEWESLVSLAGWQARLIDLGGRTVLERTLQSATEVFDVSSLPGGTYFLQVIERQQPIGVTRVEIIR